MLRLLRPALLFSFFLTLIYGCSSSKKISELTENDMAFSLSKGVCFGKCPVYTLTVYNNGYTVFYGRGNVSKMGKHSKMVSKEKLKQLEKAFKEKRFFNFKDHYESDIPDLPTITISQKKGNKTKTVEGKINRPEEIMELQFLLEAIVKSDGWELLEAPKKEDLVRKEYTRILYDQIIIEPRKGLILPQWFRKYSQYKLRIMERISPNLNLWLITYDERAIEGRKLMAMLKKDPDLVSAEFNKTVSNRRNR